MKICKVEGCDNKVFGHGYCNKHYMQIKRHGEIQTINKRTPNEIIEYEDYAEIILLNKNCEEVGRALIDLDSIQLIQNIKWYLHSDGYVRNRKIGSLHRFLMQPPDNMVVDHINRNKLDNRKENLRICTQHENNFNMPNKSICRGVSKVSKSNTYRARITINGKEKHLGTFKTIEEAIEARRQAEIDYFGEFAPHLNDDRE